MLQSLGFDPWLWCRSAQYNSGRCSGEVFLSPWSRLTPVLLAQSKLRSLQAASAVELFGVTCSSHIPATSSHCLLPLHRCPPGWETGGKFSGRNVKNLSVPSLLEDWDSLMDFYKSSYYFLHSFRVKWAAFLQAPLLLRLGAGYLPSRDFVVKFIVLYLNTNLSGFSPSLFKQAFFLLFFH